MNAKEIYEAIFLAKNTDHLRLEKEAGLGSKSVYRALAGNYGSLSAGTAKKIHALYPDLSLSWLTTGVGDMLAASQASPVASATQEEKVQPDYMRMLVETHAALMQSHTVVMATVDKVDKMSDDVKATANEVKRLAASLDDLQDNILAAGDVPAALQVWLGENLERFVGRGSREITGEIGELAEEARKLRVRSTETYSRKGKARA